MNGPTFPFAAIVGQDDLRLGLVLSVIDPAVSGILIRGEKGTAKSTAVRALAALLPLREEVSGNPFHLTKAEYQAAHESLGLPEEAPATVLTRVQVVELPVGATEDRLSGTLDMESALTQGRRVFEPGLLATAHRGILYVDEVNLLDDHLVDVLLDSAASGVNTVEREGISITHPARFSLIGTMNPEEGELRPQLLDRFGLCVTVAGTRDIAERVSIMQRRAQFDADPEAFVAAWAQESDTLATRIQAAMGTVGDVEVPDAILVEIAETSIKAGVDGHRGDLVMLRAARAHAAWQGRGVVDASDVDIAARLALPHRMRRQPLEEVAAWTR